MIPRRTHLLCTLVTVAVPDWLELLGPHSRERAKKQQQPKAVSERVMMAFEEEERDGREVPKIQEKAQKPNAVKQVTSSVKKNETTKKSN